MERLSVRSMPFIDILEDFTFHLFFGFPLSNLQSWMKSGDSHFLLSLQTLSWQYPLIDLDFYSEHNRVQGLWHLSGSQRPPTGSFYP